VRRLTPQAVLALALVLCVLLTPALATSSARATTRTVSSTSPSNPLVGPWGVYAGPRDSSYVAWQKATGTNKTLLAKIARRPKMQWFGGWIPTSAITAKMQDHIKKSQNGDPEALTQMAIFREFIGGEGKRNNPITSAQQSAYRGWVDAAARGIGSAPVAMVLEPDLAVGLKGWRPDVRLAMVRYAAQKFSALPRTTVYLDAGDGDWLKIPAAVDMLKKAGVAYTRGFALGATHYASTSLQLTYGRQLVSALKSAGVPDRHFVVDTADNGRGFTWLQHKAAYPHGDFDTAPVCRTTTQLRCVTLGIVPTTNTGDPANADAYLWFGRAWLYKQADPFVLSRALGMARTTPYH
jgi:hypothetical protein